ncbi:dynamin family protein [Bacillus thuringiensis]|uniref:dynamin family protein n=1 Tax=Bacillus thuringiensis TaxID=1428 RepID=UPI003F6B1880
MIKNSKVVKKSRKGTGGGKISDLNEEMNTYIRKFERLKLILNDSHFTGEATDKLLSRIDMSISKFKDAEFHIAIIGVVKAGKSSLVNSIIGKELASTSVNPETAVLTKFRAGFGKNFIRVKFYSSSEWKELWDSVHENGGAGFLDEYKNLKADHEKDKWIDHEDEDIEVNDEQDLKKSIEEWTSSRSPEHFFVKEVEVGIKDFVLPEKIVFVDTPGLNDVVSYRSNVTKKFLNSANAVLLCVLSKALNAGDLQDMYPIFNKCSENPEKLYIIGTQIDILNNPINDWTDIKRKWITYFDGRSCYNSHIKADNNIIGVSSYLYNLSRKHESLTEKERKTLVNIIEKYDGDVKNPIREAERISNVSSVRDKIFDETISYHQTSLVEDIKYEFNSIKEEIRAYLVNSQKQQQGLLTSSNGDLSQIEKEYEDTNTVYQNILSQKKDLQQTMSGITRQAEEDFYLLKKNIQSLI